MFQSKASEPYRSKVAFDWMLLAALAGMVNVGGLLACHRFVTHITGFATLFGVEAVAGHFAEAVGMFTVPLFFLGGAILAALLVEHPMQRGQRPHYTTTMVLISSALIAAAVMGQMNAFGEFGGEVSIGRDYILMALLCGASGLQNSVISTSSGTTVRLTHLTGLTTDLASGLVRLWAAREPAILKRERQSTLLRLGTIFSFISGGLVGAWLFRKIHYLGFLAPAAIALYAVWLAAQHRRRLMGRGSG